MNILLFIFGLLLLFSLSLGALWEKSLLVDKESTSFLGYCAAFRKVQNASERFFYKSAPKKKKPSPSTKKDLSPFKEKKNRSEKKPPEAKAKTPLPCGSLPLRPLLIEGKENHKALYIVFARLIAKLYAPVHFFTHNAPKDFEYLFVDKLLQAAKRDFPKKSFVQLSLEDPLFQKIFYQMLKGSTSPSTPSLLCYIQTTSEKEKTLCLPSASKEVFVALFNEPLAEELLKKKKVHILKESNLRECLSSLHFCDPKEIDVFPLLHFSHKKEEKPSQLFLSEKDEKSKVRVMKTLQNNEERK